MADRGSSEGFVLMPQDHQGARHKDSYFPLRDDHTSELKDTEAKYIRVKSDFYELLEIINDKASFPWANCLEAHLQFTVGYPDDLAIFQNLWHDYTEVTLPTLSPSRLLYVADKWNKCDYLIDTGAAVSVLPKSCADGTADTSSYPTSQLTIPLSQAYGTCKRVVDVGLKRDYAWTFIVADIKQPILRADLLIHYSLLVDWQGRCFRDMRTSLAIHATFSSIKPLSLNRRLCSKHRIAGSVSRTKGHPVFVCPQKLIAPDKLVTAKRAFSRAFMG